MAVKKRKGLTIKQREILSGFLFISPWLFGVIYFFLFNIFQAGRYSVNAIELDTVYGGFSLIPRGMANFRFAVLEHATFNRELVESITDMVVSVPLIIFFSLFMAVALNRQFMGRGMVRAIFFLPVVMATAAIAGSMEMVMRMMMGGVSGVPPEMLEQETAFHAGAIANMLSEFGVPMVFISYILDAIARLYDVMRATGVQILIFLAALQAVPGSMYEVAQIEGATAYETFWKITFPMVSPFILTNVVYTIIDTYTQSTVVQTAFNTAFMLQNFGLSSAMSIISSGTASLVLLVVAWIISRRVFYQVGE